MRSTSRIVLAVLLLPYPALSQSKPEAPKLSDAYAKAAFLALKAIERDHSENGLKETKRAIDEADAEASSKEERSVTDALNHLEVDHEINNSESRLDLLRATDLKTISDREASCFGPFEEALRDKQSSIPAACKSTIRASK